METLLQKQTSKKVAGGKSPLTEACRRLEDLNLEERVQVFLTQDTFLDPNEADLSTKKKLLQFQLAADWKADIHQEAMKAAEAWRNRQKEYEKVFVDPAGNVITKEGPSYEDAASDEEFEDEAHEAAARAKMITEKPTHFRPIVHEEAQDRGKPEDEAKQPAQELERAERPKANVTPEERRLQRIASRKRKKAEQKRIYGMQAPPRTVRLHNWTYERPLFTKICAICASHKHREVDKVSKRLACPILMNHPEWLRECKYPLCQRAGLTLHHISVCTRLQGLCGHCRKRGHVAEECSGLDDVMKRRLFLAWRNQGMLTRTKDPVKMQLWKYDPDLE